MATMQRNANKRFSGIYDSQHIPSTTFAGVDSGLVRRTSKRSSNKDRKGQVFADDDQQATSSGRVTPESAVTTLATHEDQRSSPSSVPSSISRSEVSRIESARDRLVANTDGRPRPRTRTLDERAKKSSFENKIRNRVGSTAATQPMPSEPDPSIGFPPATVTSPATLQKRPHTKPPSRPLSPMNAAEAPIISGLPSPNNDIERMIYLMKTTAGRMHGILFFRRARSEPWSSGYCAINVASGTLIYQMKGDVSHAKPLIPDLRGCTVRTELDPETNSHFLEIASRTSDFVVHLKPHVPEAIESWLAALLCWQPLVPRSAGPVASIDTTITAKPIFRQSLISSRRNSGVNLLRDAAIIKVGKMLFWDRDVPPPHLANSTQRISTYKQQRSASGTSWKKVSCTLQENGLLKMYGDPETTLLHQIPLSALRRFAVQRLHPSVMEDEYCLAIYPQYRASNTTALALNHPIFLSFETRILFEVWFVLLRAFTTAELYGPEQPSVRASVDLTASDPKMNISSFDQLFRVERVLALRIIEAKVFASPQGNAGSEERAAGRTRGNATAELAVGDYHAEARIDGEIRGRAAVRPNTGNPFWREDYDFYDLPPVIKSAVITIKSQSRGQKDWVVIPDAKIDSTSQTENLGLISDIRISRLNMTIGSIDLPLESLDRGKDSEQWWSLTNEKGEVVGEILLKIRIDEAVVLMAKHYEPVFEMLCKFATGLTQQIAFAVPAEFNKLHETLLNIFQYSNHASTWLMSLVEDEIDGIHKDAPAPRYRYSRRIASNDAHDMSVDREWTLRDAGKNATQEANLLFRGNSLLTKALDLHMRRLGKEFLEDTLGERIRDIDESDPDCEVDPNRIKQKDDLPRNWRNLIALTESVWIAIKTTIGRCPPELRAIFRHVRACADDRYGAFLRNIKYSSVSGFLFLRFFCPAVLNPKLFGLLKDQPRPRALRTLTFIAKSLQCLANLSTFGNKEAWMEPMNQFITTHRQEFKEYIDQICTISSDQSASRIPPSYATPQTILSRLPPTAKEGFPSLPYLIDQARELATLTNGWIEATGDNRPTVQDGEDIAAFDRLCYIIRERTSSTINCARRTDQPNGAVDGNLEGVAETYDRRTRSSLYRSTESGSLVSRSNPVSPRSPTGAFPRYGQDIRQTGISEGYQSTSSRNSSQISLQSDYNGEYSQGRSQADTGGQPSPPLLSPALSATLSPTSWDASENEGAERFPSHAISWEKSDLDKKRGVYNNNNGAVEDDPHGTRQDQTRSSRYMAANTDSGTAGSAGIDSTNNSQLPFTMSTSTYDDRTSTSPREGGRKFTDVWVFRRKDREREKDKSESGSDIAPRRERPTLTIDKRGTLTKKDREREKREREKEVRVLLDNPKLAKESRDAENKGKGQVKK